MWVGGGGGGGVAIRASKMLRQSANSTQQDMKLASYKLRLNGL